MFTTNRLLHWSTVHKVRVQYLSAVMTAAQVVPMSTLLSVEYYKMFYDLWEQLFLTLGATLNQKTEASL